MGLGARRRRAPSAPRVRVPLGIVAPLALIALYGVVQGLYLRPPSARDGMTYFERAAAFPDVDADHWSLRIGLLLPVRALQEIFGYSEAAYYGVPLLSGAVLVVATYVLGRQLFGAAVGAGAAVLLVLNRVFLHSSSLLLPDQLSTALFVSAIALLIFVASRTPRTSRLDGLLVVAGLLLGWAYLVREYIALLFPVVLVVSWTYRLSWKRLVWLAAPAAAVLGGELVLNLVLHGSPLERLLVSGVHGGQRDYIDDSRLDALLRLPRALRDTPGGTPVLLALALFPFVVTLGRRPSRILGAWFLSFWGAITLGTGLVEPSFRFIIADKLRYWTPLLPALAIGGVAVVHRAAVVGCSHSRLSPALRARLAAVAVVAFALVVGVAGTSDERADTTYRVNGATELSELRAWLAGEGVDAGVIWTDSYTAHLIPVYSRTTWRGTRVWSGEVRRFEEDGKFVGRGEMDRGAIVLYRPGYSILAGHPPSAVRGYLRHPDPEWRVALSQPDRSLVIYRITR